MYNTKVGPKNGWVYIVSNKWRTVLYIGITGNIRGRIHEHRIGEGSVFTKKYNLTVLLHYEWFEHIEDAILREKQLKRWHRDWKFNLIKQDNSEMMDLWEILWEK